MNKIRNFALEFFQNLFSSRRDEMSVEKELPFFHRPVGTACAGHLETMSRVFVSRTHPVPMGRRPIKNIRFLPTSRPYGTKNIFERGLFYVLHIACCCALLCNAAEPPPNVAITELSNAELIQEYTRLAESAKREERYVSATRIPAPDERLHAVQRQATQEEIVQRGAQIVPALIAFLEEEVPIEREKYPKTGVVVSFVGDALQMLAQIGDPRAVPLALRILEGWDGKANEQKQLAALNALEKLTYFSFRRVRPHWYNYADSIEHLDATGPKYITQNVDFTTLAKLYREWLNGEGKDPSQWLELAGKRARQLLAGDDPDQVFCAAKFLRPSAGRDNDPDTTLARIAKIVGETKKSKQYDGEHAFAGKPLPVVICGWTAMVTDYGPRAQPYAAILLRIQKEQGMNSYTLREYIQLWKVGGPEILSFFFEVLPKVNAEAKRVPASVVREGFNSEDPRGWWFDAQREARFGIDRWAGRVFDSDAERETWWKATKTKSSEERLFANLDVLNGQVADGKPLAWAIAREVLPDMPGCPVDWWEAEKEKVKGRVAEPFRLEWLSEHREKLRYDANAGCFRLTNEGVVHEKNP